MASQIMRITLKAYDHQLIDASAKSIIETVKKTGSKVSGPVPMPTKKEVVTILRAVHKYKDSREQFEQRTHKRLIDIITPTQKTVDASPLPAANQKLFYDCSSPHYVVIPIQDYCLAFGNRTLWF